MSKAPIIKHSYPSYRASKSITSETSKGFLEKLRVSILSNIPAVGALIASLVAALLSHFSNQNAQQTEKQIQEIQAQLGARNVTLEEAKFIAGLIPLFNEDADGKQPSREIIESNLILVELVMNDQDLYAKFEGIVSNFSKSVEEIIIEQNREDEVLQLNELSKEFYDRLTLIGEAEQISDYYNDYLFLEFSLSENPFLMTQVFAYLQPITSGIVPPVNGLFVSYSLLGEADLNDAPSDHLDQIANLLPQTARQGISLYSTQFGPNTRKNFKTACQNVQTAINNQTTQGITNLVENCASALTLQESAGEEGGS